MQDDLVSISCDTPLRVTFPRLSVAAVLELFHLLPPAAAKFLDPMVCLTIQLEKALPPAGVYSELNSPYRLPLTKFLNRYSADAVDYFLQRLNQPPFFTR